MSLITRNNNQDILIIQSDKGVVTVSKKSFLATIFVDTLIRLPLEEHNSINNNTKYLTHFNLDNVNHKVREIVALPSIVTPGYYTSSTEVLPVLSFENCYVGICIEVRNNVSYQDLHQDDFKFSFPHIKNKKDLQQAILARYRQSMPELTNTQILALGVAITHIKLMGTLKEYLSKHGSSAL